MAAIDGRARGALQALIAAIWPPQCLCCDALVASDSGLCGKCWRETPFIAGLACGLCGAPLPGDQAGEGAVCDDCTGGRPWKAGRAALLYQGTGRRLALGLKHGDRLDLAPVLARWMLRAARPMLEPLPQDLLVVPVPLHPWRLFRRRYNQAAVLSQRIARLGGFAHCPDALIRRGPARSQEGRDRLARQAGLAGVIRAHPKRLHHLAGRSVLLVDDVMTTGATLSAAAQALVEAGVPDLRVLVLARVANEV